MRPTELQGHLVTSFLMVASRFHLLTEGPILLSKILLEEPAPLAAPEGLRKATSTRTRLLCSIRGRWGLHLIIIMAI